MHGTTLSVGNTFTSSEQFADDGSYSATAHQGETVASVGGDDVVELGDGVFDTNGNCLLSSRQVAETTDLLLLVQAVGGHFHLPAGLSANCITSQKQPPVFQSGVSVIVPDGDHVVVHLLQLLLGYLDGVRRGVQLVGLEALITEGDLERLVLGLRRKNSSVSQLPNLRALRCVVFFKAYSAVIVLENTPVEGAQSLT